MEGVGGTLKRSVFNAVKSGKIVVNNSEGFAIAANDIVNGIHTIFMHDDEIMTEPQGVDEATYIHKGYPSNSPIRSSREQKRSVIIKFYELSNDETPFFTQWYPDEGEIVCGHEDVSISENECGKCLKYYKGGEDWTKCPLCAIWFHNDCYYI